MFKTPLKLNMTILIALLLGLTINANANMLKIEGGVYIFDDPLNLVIVRGKVDGTELQLFKDEILGWIGQSEISFSGALSNIPGFKSGQGVGYISSLFNPKWSQQVNISYNGQDGSIYAIHWADFVRFWHAYSESLGFIKYPDQPFTQLLVQEPILIAAVPEPATMLLFGTGLIGLVGFSIRRKKK